MKIFGNDYDTRDGTCERDFVHVCDLAYSHVLALENISSISNFEVLNSLSKIMKKKPIGLKL